MGKVSICINFSFNAKWKSIAWLSMFWNLHIFISVQQICHLVNAKRKVNIPIFTIWNSHGPSVNTPNHGQGYTKSKLQFSTPHFSSNEVLLKWLNNQELSYTCFRVFGTLAQFGETRSNQINPKPLTLCVRSNEALIQGQGYLRVELYLF